MMHFTTLYAETLTLWPKEIEISYGQNIIEDGGYFLNLNEQWQKAEQLAEGLTKSHQLMAWAIFSELHHCALERYSSGYNTVQGADCNLESIEKIFAENLFKNGANYTEKMKSGYVNDLNEMT
jgi:hypothetical protein